MRVGAICFSSGDRGPPEFHGDTERPRVASEVDGPSVFYDCGKRLQVPSDLSIISFDNTPIVRQVQPPLTAVEQPIAETAAKAVELIVADQRGVELPQGPVVVPASLVHRQSTARCKDSALGEPAT